MNKLQMFEHKVAVGYEEHKAEIYLGAGIATGVVAAVMAVKAAPKANAALEQFRINCTETSKAKRILGEIRTVAPFYAPSLAIASLALVCIGGSYRITTKRYAAMSAACSLAENRFSEYQRKVIEKLGEKKEAEIQKELIEDRVKNCPVGELENGIIQTGHGDDLFLDFESGRWFRSSIDYINNTFTRVGGLNEELRAYDEVSLNSVYAANDLPEIGFGDVIKWRTFGSHRCDTIEPRFEPGDNLTDNGKPYIVFSFYNRPTAFTN